MSDLHLVGCLRRIQRDVKVVGLYGPAILRQLKFVRLVNILENVRVAIGVIEAARERHRRIPDTGQTDKLAKREKKAFLASYSYPILE